MRYVFLVHILGLALYAGAQKSNSTKIGNVVVIKNHIKSEKKVGLTNDELNEIENILGKCITDNNETEAKESTAFLKPLSKYNRQYFPYYENGEKKVLVNCFCESVKRFAKWKKEVVAVYDGGSCYFMVSVNLTKKKYSDLYINGVG